MNKFLSKLLRARLGKRCTFVATIKEGGNEFLVIYMTFGKSRDKWKFLIDGSSERLNATDLRNVVETMEKHYSMAKEIKKFYHVQLTSGDLLELYPKMTGEWEKDKDDYIREYMETQEILEHIDEDIELTDEEEVLPEMPM